MNKLVICIFSTLCIPLQATILDQSQEQVDGGLLVISSDWSFAQTFTAGLTGQLEKIELYLDNTIGTDLYPTTVSVVNVINSVPSGSVLATIYADSLSVGYNNIDFLSEYVSLSAGSQYGIVLDTTDPDHTAGSSTQWASVLGDVYTGGSVWIYYDEQWTQVVTPPPGGGPTRTLYDVDAAFRTYMVPEPTTLLLLGLGAVLLRRNR